MDYFEELESGRLNQKEYQKTLKRLKKKKNKEVDSAFEDFHEEAFESIDCLNCANCCKTTSPIFRDIDIKRISKKLKVKEKEFINSNLRMDQDGDYVLKTSPCLFLDTDNTCSIYEDRPLACREYPHTNRKNMYQIFDLTLRNSEVCPAVVTILDQINLKYK